MNMPSVTACLNRDQLIALMQGKLPVEDAEPLAAHVETCSQCVAALQELRAGDAGVDFLGPPRHGEPAQGPAWLESLIAKLGRPASPAVGADATIDSGATIHENARRVLEAAWSRGQPEPIEALLPAEDHPHYQATLLEVIQIELE